MIWPARQHQNLKLEGVHIAHRVRCMWTKILETHGRGDTFPNAHSGTGFSTSEDSPWNHHQPEKRNVLVFKRTERASEPPGTLNANCFSEFPISISWIYLEQMPSEIAFVCTCRHYWVDCELWGQEYGKRLWSGFLYYVERHLGLENMHRSASIRWRCMTYRPGIYR